MKTASQATPFMPPHDLWDKPHAWARALAHRVIEPVRHTRSIQSTLSLNKSATTWVAKPLGRRVTCESGTLWLCFDGEPQDIVLEPGDTHLCAKHSALSIHALSPSVVRLD
jgi:Protein of unknown function (DUF2917)